MKLTVDGRATSFCTEPTVQACLRRLGGWQRLRRFRVTVALRVSVCVAICTTADSEGIRWLTPGTRDLPLVLPYSDTPASPSIRVSHVTTRRLGSVSEQPTVRLWASLQRGRLWHKARPSSGLMAPSQFALSPDSSQQHGERTFCTQGTTHNSVRFHRLFAQRPCEARRART